MRDIEQHAYTVNTLQTDGCIEEELLVHVPFRIENAVAKAGFEFCGNRTGTLVNLNLVLAIDESQHVIARNRVAAVLALLLFEVVVGNEDWLLAIEFLGYNKELCLVFSRLFLLVAVEERHILSPATLITSVFAQQFVNILVAQ